MGASKAIGAVTAKQFGMFGVTGVVNYAGNQIVAPLPGSLIRLAT